MIIDILFILAIAAAIGFIIAMIQYITEKRENNSYKNSERSFLRSIRRIKYLKKQNRNNLILRKYRPYMSNKKMHLRILKNEYKSRDFRLRNHSS